MNYKKMTDEELFEEAKNLIDNMNYAYDYNELEDLRQQAGI